MVLDDAGATLALMLVASVLIAPSSPAQVPRPVSSAAAGVAQSLWIRQELGLQYRLGCARAQSSLKSLESAL